MASVKSEMEKKFTRTQRSVTHGFGDRIAQERRAKAYREQRDIGQKDVAEAVGATRPSVSRWEAGGSPPNDEMIARLAAYFGVTPGWLRYGQEPRVAVGAPTMDLEKPQRGFVPQKRKGGGKASG